MTKHLNISIFGRVQGVGFRWSAKEKADSLRIAGFAENRSANTVYIEAEGAEPDLEKFVEWCRKGSMGSKVDNVEAVEAPVLGFNGFEIK